ncbi:adenine deaminase [Rubeoparvulum massiliense]|uniref:adenine deaminase n=1 Tax=Rubeoparvulum massiliense TaxID=1631346 RepID=UPI00065E508A|nr:adenine deaminase [Rubeoparvulum massiliense]
MKKINEEMLRRIRVAAGEEPADLVITNCRVADLFQLEWFEEDVAIVDGTVVGIGKYEGKQVIDGLRRYLVPAFMDGHVHIESSTVTPPLFAEVLLQHGVTAAVCDPHEIANVAGVEGIQYMLDASENVPVDLYFMLPSCVPSTPMEEAGAVLDAADLAPFFQHPRVLGLAEVMDFPAVAKGSEGMMEKLTLAYQDNHPIDGHGAGLDGRGLNIYRSVQIQTDHEAITVEDAKLRLQRGFYLMIREGSGARNLRSLIQAVTPANARRCLFCTDDKHLDDLVTEGSVDYNVRLAIQEGMDPLLAIQMASLNAAECYNMHDRGAIAPGYRADLLLLDSLDEVTISMVIKDGKIVVDKHEQKQAVITSLAESIMPKPSAPPAKILHSVRLAKLEEEMLQIPATEGSHAHVIEVIPGQLLTHHLLEEVEVEQGYFHPSTQLDQLKLAVLERHRGTGHLGLGIVKGFGMMKGAIASTVGHDSHNLIILGTNDADMLTAIQAIEQIQGGLAVVIDGKVEATLALPVAGLMSDQGVADVLKEWEQLDQALQAVQFTPGINPFLLLSFLSLPVIPHLKITTRGLFDVDRFTHIDVIQPEAMVMGQ